MIRLLKFILLMFETSIAGFRIILLDGYEVIDIELSIAKKLSKEEQLRVNLEEIYKSSEDNDV